MRKLIAISRWYDVKRTAYFQYMSRYSKQLANPQSTGGAGPYFENQVQTAFVVLMLTGGIAPCLPLPIKSIRLQARHLGYNTDDIVIFAEDVSALRKAKLLAQIKLSLSVTARDLIFGEVIKAAWLDFQNPKVFDPLHDSIALVTGPLSATDIENARQLLEWARGEDTAKAFLEKVGLAKFSSNEKRAKLQAFRMQLKKANGGVDVGDDNLWRFLRSFHMLGYDLDIKSGVTRALLNSHISQFSPENVLNLWGAIATEVQTFNQTAGVISHETLSNEVSRPFLQRLVTSKMPVELLPSIPASTGTEALTSEQRTALVVAALLGKWNDGRDGDRDAIRKLVEGND